MLRIKKNDDVKVVSGNYSGETGRVIKVLHAKNRVIVEGVNKAKKHINDVCKVFIEMLDFKAGNFFVPKILSNS